MAEQVVRLLAPKPGDTLVDATSGAGGHSEALLEACDGGSLVALDRDPSAVEATAQRLSRFGDRVTSVHGRFSELSAVLAALGRERVDAVLVDLGVSSMQLDHPERGFSFARPGPIDMRMDPSAGPTALELIRSTPTDELAEILRDYGEERYSKRIAAALRDGARAGGLETTGDLAGMIADAIPGKAKRHLRIHPATRTFQALRIAVNRELDELDRFLEIFPDLLEPGGRCAVISFHSLEDRRVKRRFRALAVTSTLPRHLALAAGERVDPICELLTRRAVTATDDEIAANPRARSARLRACRRPL